MARLPQTRRSVLVVLVAALVAILAAGLAVVVILGSDDREPTERPQAAPDTLRDLDTTAITITRDSFCAQMPDEAPAAALDAAPADAATYGNGEAAKLTARIKDVAHEFACSWSTDDAAARGWVFAPPVTRSQARDFTRSSRNEQDCRRWSDAPTYGGPTIGLICTRGKERTVSLRGLFGDAWLSCSLSAPKSSSDSELRERGEQWCADVLQAARVR